MRIKAPFFLLLLLTFFLPKSWATLILNPSFETAFFANWSGGGNVDLRSDPGAVTHGNVAAYLETGAGSTEQFLIEAVMRIPSGATDGLGVLLNDAIQGSFVSNWVYAPEGYYLLFDWNFMTQHQAAQSPASSNDFAFFSVHEAVHFLADTTFKPWSGSSTLGFPYETGYQTYIHQFPKTGGGFFGFGVFDEETTYGTSALLIDNVRITSQRPAALIPEPTTMFLTGLGLVGFLRSRS